MDPQIPSIKALPANVVAQIKSSAAITNLNGVVLELLKNSLDADAWIVTITVDFQRGGCVVEDNGCGIPPTEFQEDGGLVKLHHTSKFNCPHETYGHRGLFLASLVSLALVTITSRHESQSTTSTLICHRSKPIARLIPAPSQHELDCHRYGTRVTVNDLFGNLPVRVKHRALTLRRNEDLDKEWDDLKAVLTGLLLAFPRHVKVTVVDTDRTRKLVFRGRNPEAAKPPANSGNEACSDPLDMERIRTILSQATYITPSSFRSWVTASARTSGISIHSAISLEPSPTKQVQFISFGINPTFSQSNANVLYNEINRLFTLSSFGCTDDAPEIARELEGLHIKDKSHQAETVLHNRPKPSGKSINRWPMFYVRIGIKDYNSPFREGGDSLESSKSLQTILDVLGAMVCEFLEQHRFRPRSRNRTKRVRNVSPSPNRTGERDVKRSRSCVPAIPCRDVPNKERLHEQNTEDFLTSEVRLPNFSTDRDIALNHNAQGFGSWSKVKSGSRNVFDDICSGLPRGKGSGPSNCSSVAENNANSIVAGNDGNLARPSGIRTRSMVTTDESTSLSPAKDLTGSEEASSDNSPADQVIPWANPITKESVLINSRTGQALSTSHPAWSLFRGTHPPEGSPTRIFQGLRSRDAEGVSPRLGSWLNTVLEEWENPAFRQPEIPVPWTTFGASNVLNDGRNPGELMGHHSCAQAPDPSFVADFTKLNHKLTRKALRDADVIGQVDNKFVLVRMSPDSDGNKNPDKLLVLVDQHAADERCRIEQLFEELFNSSGTAQDTCSPFPVQNTALSHPIVFQISSHESRLFERYSAFFMSWGCHYELSKDSKDRDIVAASKLPTLIAERCRVKPELVANLLRGEIWARENNGRRHGCSTAQPQGPEKLPRHRDPTESTKDGKPQLDLNRHSWLEHIGDCPKGIINLLNSRACRSAVMFNDTLSLGECRNLISRLSHCAFPFQCAHGRPSMVPIVNLASALAWGECPTAQGHSAFDRLADRNYDPLRTVDEANSDFARAFRAWKAAV